MKFICGNCGAICPSGAIKCHNCGALFYAEQAVKNIREKNR